MVERALGFVLLVCAALSALMMWTVQSNISYTQNTIAEKEGPAALNYLLQSDSNIDEFIASLRALQLEKIENGVAAEATINYSQRRYDVLWSSLSIFNFQFPVENTYKPLLDAFALVSDQFIQETEPLMDPSHELTLDDVNQLVVSTRKVSAGVRRLGHGYYMQGLLLTDKAMLQIENLSGYIRLFTALLLLTGGVGVWLIVRSNTRTKALFVAAEKAKLELAHTVDELRSGKREQKAKDSFIAAANHDLRQPLHALGLFLNTLKTSVKPDGERALNEAIECKEVLNRLFNSLLDLSRLDAGVVQVEDEQFDLARLLANMRSQVQPSAELQGVQIHLTGGDAYAKTDSLLLQSIIRNLLDNAIAHSEGTQVSIKYSAVKGGHRIRISDNGRGIPEAEHAAIFSEYYQLSNPERDRSKGLGLGLAIVKRLSDLLGVNLQMKSTPGKGTTFSLLVPMGEEIPQETLNAIASSKPISNTNNGAVIVVIDDDSSIRKAMHIVLTLLNFHPVCAETTDDALEQLAESQLEPDLIIADYRLRDHMTGTQAIEDLCDAVEKQVPALIVTGDTSPARVSELTASGFDVLHKPVATDLLNNKILHMLNAERHSGGARDEVRANSSV